MEKYKGFIGWAIGVFILFPLVIYLYNLAKGFGGAAVGFAIDQISNKIEDSLQNETIREQKPFNDMGSSNGVSVSAINV